MNALDQLVSGLPPAEQKAANDVVDGLCRLASCGALREESLEYIIGTLSEDLADAWLARTKETLSGKG